MGINRKTGFDWRRERIGRKRVRTKLEVVPEAPIGRGGSRFSLEDRIQIADLRINNLTMAQIAGQLGCSASSISRELKRGSVDGKYRPHHANQLAKVNQSRPKASKIASNKELREFIERELDQWSSPEQISVMLKQAFPDDPEMWVTHETIYQALYVQGRGSLRRELALCLRTGRAKRKPHRRADGRQARFTDEMVMISERPPEVEDRAVPGHWEGDLIIGKNNQSAIGTLVERSTRYVMLVHLEHGRTGEAMAKALAETMMTLPEHLKGSLTWDQGSEMSQHKAFSFETDIPVYFCDPGSPWQRGSNENTNGLLRQYFPKGTDLSQHSKQDLIDAAASLNRRIRKTLDWDNPAKRLADLIDQSA